MVVMRSVFYVPGNNWRFIEKAPTIPADIITLDLEDSVPPAEKETARFMVKDSIKRVKELSGTDVYVRINGWLTGLTEEDLNAIVQEGLDGVCLPKCEGAEQVKKLEKKLEELEKQRGIKKPIAIQLLIETAKGVELVYEAATASPRVNSLIYGAVDYTRDMRVKMTKEAWESLYPRMRIGQAARAAGVIAIDYPYPDIGDLEGFRKDCEFGKQFGMEGRMLIHPSQVEIANQVYKPSDEDIQYAKEACAAFEKAMQEGRAAIDFRGKMVDIATYGGLKAILEMAKAIEEKERARKERAKTSS
ncbi:MAG: CoA ester lyase [Nitrososphaerales archaeon]